MNYPGTSTVFLGRLTPPGRLPIGICAVAMVALWLFPPRLLSDYQLYTFNLALVNILLAVGLYPVIGVARQCLAERSRQWAGTLSGGEQQMLAIGRASMALPKLLLLDEPSLGPVPIVVDAVYQIIGRLASDGLVILLAEQNVTKALSVAEKSFILENGTVSASGARGQLAATSFVQKAFLG